MVAEVMKMIVTFCGHSQLDHKEAVKTWLTDVTKRLIFQGATTFYLGGYGEFDSLAASVLREHKKRYPQVELVLVLAYFPSAKDTSGYDATVYPPLGTVPRRFAICCRNRWMVNAADVVVNSSCTTGAVLHPPCGTQSRKRRRSSPSLWRKEDDLAFCFVCFTLPLFLASRR